jgi:hypothetical protein
VAGSPAKAYLLIGSRRSRSAEGEFDDKPNVRKKLLHIESSFTSAQQILLSSLLHFNMGNQNARQVGVENHANINNNLPIPAVLGADQLIRSNHQRHGSGYIAFNDDQHFLANPWPLAQPEDVYYNIFTFLSQRALCRVSLVNHSWHKLVYDPTLWRILHLCKIYNRIDDLLIEHTFKSGRFAELEVLCLDNCSAITYRSMETLSEFCPRLQALSLANCDRINPYLLIDFIQRMPCLRKLEIIGLTNDWNLVLRLLHVKPRLDLGLFYVEHCAENGIRMDMYQNKWSHNERRYSIELDATHQPGSEAKSNTQLQLAVCRYAGRVVDNNQRGCWGQVKGRIVYSSNFYHTAGNFPSLVLYSCEQHAEEDYTDESYHRCRMCERLFIKESMWSPMICKFCFDMENLSNKSHWIPLLNTKELKSFGFTQVVNQTVRIADRKNLPRSLQSFGSTVCKLDYTSEEKDALIDPQNVNLSVFLDQNAQRLDQTMHNLRNKLKEAREAGNIRGLLVMDKEENLELFADERVIADGQEGEQFLRIILLAWRSIMFILYPVALIVLFTSHFSWLLNLSVQSRSNPGVTDYAVYIRQDSPTEISPVILLALAGGIILFLVGCMILFFRFRQLFERIFKKFLALDLLAIFAFGTGVILWTFFQWVGAYFDWLSLALVVFNFSALCLAALYFYLPSVIHQLSVASLNCYMAVLLAGFLGRWFCLSIAGIVALADLASDFRPQIRLLTPFLVPDAMIIPTTPRILYSINGLHVRPIDLMLFGLLSICTDNVVISLTVILGSLAICVFILPFVVGKKKYIRPIPLMFLLFLLLTFIQYDVIEDAGFSWSSIK